MYQGLQGITQWQAWRNVASGAADTPLTDYKQSDLSDTVKEKMISIHPSTVIAVRLFGQGSDLDTVVLTVSGWMDLNKKSGPGFGQRLYSGTATLSAKNIASSVPIVDDIFSSGTWREIDTWNVAGGVDSGAVLIPTAGGADKENMWLLPTYGYTYLLLEASSFSGTTRVGVIWRPAHSGGVIKAF